MKLHWKILLMLVVGVMTGGAMRSFLDHPSEFRGATFESDGGPGVVVATLDSGSPAAKAKLAVGDRILRLILNKDRDDERKIEITSLEQFNSELGALPNGFVVLVETVGKDQPLSVAAQLQLGSPLDQWVHPFRVIADIFIRFLKMLIVPLILTSIITGVAGLGGGSDFGRLGTKTFLYYVSTSFLAAAVGLILVNMIKPGVGAKLGLGEAPFEGRDENFFEIFVRMVPENPFDAFSDNANMLQVIFFSIFFGYFITRVSTPARETLTNAFSAAFDVMMKLAGFALELVPYGVFALMVKVVAETGYEVFIPLGIYMLTVFLGLCVHAMITLPTLLTVVGRVSPIRWFKAMTPVLLTAFSTSSSSMTLPVTIETVEKRGGVSNKTSSFVLPLGATINMDGTAIYECIGVLFLAQYYLGDVALSQQIYVVFAALVASIGAAGIPSAGLVMMLTILSALNLPVEGAALLLAVDRPLDMCRTAVNVWSDTCGTAILASSEKETLFGDGAAAPES